MIKFSEAPINESKLFVIMINHDVVWLDISVHDASAVTEVECLEHLVDVVSNVIVSEALVECPEVDITSVNVLHDESWCLSHWVSDDINEIDDIHSTLQSLEDLDFSSNLSLLNWLQDLDDNSLIVGGVDTLIDLRVLSSSNLLDDLVVLLGSVSNNKKSVVRINEYSTFATRWI